MLVRFSRTVTLPCVVVTGPLFSPATHVGWSAPCRFEYMAVAMGYNTQGINALTLRRQAPVTHVWHCATKWLCHQVWPCIDMLGIYVLPFIWLFVCTGCRLLHTAEHAWLPSYCSPTEPFALSLIVWPTFDWLKASSHHLGFQLKLPLVLHESSCCMFQVSKYPQGL
jgi:hypothetical protein